MASIAHALDRAPIINALHDHESPNLLTKSDGHWKRWQIDAQSWIKNLDHNSDVVCFSLSAPLLTQALLEANITVRSMIYLAPAFFYKYNFSQHPLFKNLPDQTPIPSLNLASVTCRRWLPLGLYRELWQNQFVPIKLAAKKNIVLIDQRDELIDVAATEGWCDKHAIPLIKLKAGYTPPFHALYYPNRLPIDRLRSFVNSGV